MSRPSDIAACALVLSRDAYYRAHPEKTPGLLTQKLLDYLDRDISDFDPTHRSGQTCREVFTEKLERYQAKERAKRQARQLRAAAEPSPAEPEG
jgi:hypothetical protein